VLINYVPVLAEAMRGFRMQGSGVRVAEGGGRRAKKNGRMSNIQHPTPNAQPAVSNLGPSTSGVRVVYHCVDRWDAFSVYDSAMMAEMDARCCRYADVVIASSKDLFERCMEKNPNTYLVTHGVDYEHFAKAAREERPQTGDCRPEASLSRSDGGQVEWQTGDSLPDSTPDTRPSFATATEGKLPTPNIRPSDLPAGRIVGFFGLLSEWVDQDLLVALAKRLAAYGEDGWPQEAQAGEAGAGNHPHVSIVLIGQADVDVSRLRAEPNIALLGPKPFADLPNYIRHFDVGVIPFVVNELTVAVNPIKLREMLAAGCPVVSTALPEVVAYTRDRAVEVASSREAFIAAVGQLVENPPVPSERAALSASMAGETWTAKVDQILAAIDTWPGC
jgi:glycosyltransferase involved in cell wall biosynthesis